MQSVGRMRWRLGFYKRVDQSASDPANPEGEFKTAPEFTCAAGKVPRLGGEKILADRLTGTDIVNFTVRYSSNMANVTDDWRIKDQRPPYDVFNIRSIIDPTGEKQWLELLCEKGVAT